jgi:hypothetical protein
LKTYGFDLVAFLRGEVASTPKLVLTMIRHLPEGTNYVAQLRSAPAEPADDDTDTTPAEIDPVQEALMWTHDRLLQAQLINAVNMLVRHSIQWKDGKAPELPIVGPAEWRGEGANATPSKPMSVADVLNNLMGQR